MIFKETKLPGAFLIEPEKFEDDRGFFARVFCKREFSVRGLYSRFVQCNISLNRKMGTLRGMHYQMAPHGEIKVVRCTKGTIYDVIVDLRPESPTYTQWIPIELSADNYRMLYIPKGFAHGFQTLANDTEVFYFMSEFYQSAAAAGIRWNDPTFEIRWPLSDPIVSAKDQTYPDFQL